MNQKAVSTIIGALLLIAIAVAAAILLYVFAMGLMTSVNTGSVNIFNDQLELESYNWQTPGALVLTLRNIGSTTLNLATADYYVNGQMMNSPALVCMSGSTAVNFTPKGVCAVTLTVSLASLNQGQSYPVRVAFSDGGVWQGSATFGDAG